MPTYDDDQGGKRFFHIRTVMDKEYGNLVARWATKTSENDPNKETVTNKNTGAISHYHMHKSVGGILTGIEIVKREGAKGPYFQWELTMNGGDATYVVNISLQSNSSNSVMFRLPNCDLTKEIKLTPYYFEEGEKIITGVMQRNEAGEWEKIEKRWVYNKDKKAMTNGMPNLDMSEPDPLTKKVTYDDKKQNAFMWEYFQEHIIPVIKRNNGSVQAPAEEPKSMVDQTNDFIAEVSKEGDKMMEKDDIEEDDLPF